MSNGLDIQYVRESYQQMKDDELVRIATQDAAGLTPEAQQVIADEIAKRGLGGEFVNGVQAQNRSYTVEEIDQYCELVRGLSCPECGSFSAKLNGAFISEVMSFIVLTQIKRKIKVGCPNCLDRANTKALTKTAVLGWWGIPWGIIRTIQAIWHNIRSQRTNHAEEPNDYLRTYVLAKIGEIETYKGNRERLRQIISAD